MMAKKLMLNKQAAFNQSGDSNLVNTAYYNLIYYSVLSVIMIIYVSVIYIHTGKRIIK